MANYVVELIDPLGNALLACPLELEDDGEIDSLSAFMMSEDDPKQHAEMERPIPGGYDKRCPYRVRVTKRS